MSSSTDNSFSTGHFIINHDLYNVKLLPNSSTVFIYFLNDLFRELNYDFHIEPFSYNVLFTTNEFEGFTNLIELRFGNDFEFSTKMGVQAFFHSSPTVGMILPSSPILNPSVK
jgi:hypothetical protein